MVGGHVSFSSVDFSIPILEYVAFIPAASQSTKMIQHKFYHYILTTPQFQFLDVLLLLFFSTNKKKLSTESQRQALPVTSY